MKGVLIVKKLFKVGCYQELMVYAEDVEEALLLFTENIDNDDTSLDNLIAMETNEYPQAWRNAIPYGEDDDRTCKEIAEA